RAERAVGKELHMPQLQPLVALTGAHAGLQSGLEVERCRVPDLWRHARGRERERERSMRDPHQDADLELTAITRPPERGVGARLLEGLDAGDASPERFGLCPHRCGVAIR